MIVLGVVLIVVGLLLPQVHILVTIGLVLVVLGVVLWVLGATGHPVGGAGPVVLRQLLGALTVGLVLALATGWTLAAAGVLLSDPAVIAHLEQVAAYFDDPAAAPHRNPPRPPSPEVAAEIAAACAQLAARVLEYHKTGRLPDQEPSVQTTLEVAEMFDYLLRVRDENL